MIRMLNVWVDEEQRSVAIGKMGQNIALASQLTGVQIHLVKSEVAKSELFEIEEESESE